MDKTTVIPSLNERTKMGFKVHYGWLDFLKGLAMLAVVVDHNCGVLYSNNKIQLLSFYSVTLFVFLAGITSHLSMESKKIYSYDYKYVINRLKRVILPYLFATLLSLIIVNHFFNLGTFLKTSVHFSCWSPYYFIVFFLQLIIVSPILFLIIRMCKASKFQYLLLLVSFVVITYLSYIFTKYTFVVDVYTAGKMVLGGSYFIIFFLGMLFSAYKIEYKSKLSALLSSLIAFGLLVPFAWYYLNHFTFGDPSMFINKLFPLWGKNPPSLILMAYAALIFVAFGGLYQFCMSVFPQKLMLLFKPIEYCGKYSMTIFLFHLLCMFVNTSIIIKVLPFINSNIWVLRIETLLMSVAVPVLVQILYNASKKYVVNGVRKFNNQALVK